MNKFRNLKPSIDAILANDYIDFILDSSKQFFKNKVMPKPLASSMLLDKNPTSTTLNEGNNNTNQNNYNNKTNLNNNMSNSTGFSTEQDLEFEDEDQEGVYEPKNEEDVLFPDYLAPDETVGIRRTDAFIQANKLNRSEKTQIDFKL